MISKKDQICIEGLVMKEVRDAISNILDKTSLADMLEREEKAQQQEKGDIAVLHLKFLINSLYSL